VTAVDNVSLTIPESQFLVVIGGNGSGKSTLLNLVAGTFFASRGSILLAGRDVTAMPEYRRAGLLGRVFQDPLKGTAAGLTVEENFALAEARGQFRGLRPALGRKLREEIRDRLALLEMGIENRLKSKVELLSGGQRQAITILMAVLRRPLVLLLDEHTAALDPRASRTIMDLTRSIIREQALTTLMVTHNLAHALDSGHRTILMNRGKIAHDLSAEHLATMTAEDLFALFWKSQREAEEKSRARGL